MSSAGAGRLALGERGREGAQGGAVVGNGDFGLKVFTRREDGHALVAHVATEQDLIAGLSTIGMREMPSGPSLHLRQRKKTWSR